MECNVNNKIMINKQNKEVQHNKLKLKKQNKNYTKKEILFKI